MSFKDKYTKIQNDIKPRAEFLEDLARQMEQARRESAEPLPKKTPPMKLRAFIIAAGAVTAAAAAAAFAFAPNRGSSAPLPVKNSTVTYKFSYTVGLFAQTDGHSGSEDDLRSSSVSREEESSAPGVSGMPVTGSCSRYPSEIDTPFGNNTNSSSGDTFSEKVLRMLAQDGTVVYGSRENRFGDEDRLSEAEIAKLAETAVTAVPADGAADKNAYWYMAVTEDGDIVKFRIPSGRGKGTE